MENQLTSTKTYLLVYLALLALLAATIVAALLNIGPFNLLLALLIAASKAILVVIFFMHARQSGPVTRLFVVAGLLWLLILIGLTLTDYFSRPWGSSFGL